MRIIGGKDYYDSAGWYSDDTIFLRKPFKFVENKDYYLQQEYSLGYIFFCGKMFPFGRYQNKFHYKAFELENSRKWHFNVIAKHFERTAYTPKNLDEYIEKKIAIASSMLCLDEVTNKMRINPDSTSIWANHDMLGKLNFATIKPPAEAHMEIANWVGGVLTTTKPMIELSNNDRIEKAGFDKKISFRHLAQ